MRMRLKKHLDERIAECKDILLVREGDEFYKLSEREKENFRQDLSAVFGNDNPVVLEIGCGKGAWAITSARLHPEKNYLGVEKLSNVVVVACEQALQHGVQNLKFLNCRAENLGYVLPPCSIDEIDLNFSCPFPKKTYANRRLTSKNFLALYKKILKPNAVIYQKTDDLSFFEWSIESYRENGYEVLDVCYNLPADAHGNVVTEYEVKFRAIGKPIYSLKATPPRQ